MKKCVLWWVVCWTAFLSPLFGHFAYAAGGSVFAWGYNSFGECNVPPNLTDAVELACGNYFSMALRANGTIVTWGNDPFGLREVPPTATDVVAISSRGCSAMALRRDGTLVAWGADKSIPAEAVGIVAIANGGGHNLALRRDGKLLAWGANNYGQCDVPTSLKDVVGIGAGYTHSVALTKQGQVIAWGENQGGSTTVPAEAINIVSISVGPNFNLALRADGKVVGWGMNWGGNLPVPASADGAVSVSAGQLPEFAIAGNGTVIAWGRNDTGALNVPPGLPPAFSIAAGNDHALGIRVVGQPVLWQQPQGGQAAEGDSVLLQARAAGQVPLSYQWRHDSVPIPGENSSVLLLRQVQASAAGTYDVVRHNAFGSVTSGQASLTVVPSKPSITLQPVSRALSIGGTISLTAEASGTLPLFIQWQFNGSDLKDQTNATLLLKNVISGNSGSYVAVVSNALGQATSNSAQVEVVPVFAWGNNQSGVLELPLGLQDVVGLAAGYSHNLALRTDGTVIGWGSTNYGESRSFPWLNNVTAVAAGDQCSMVLFMDRTVRGWGDTIEAPAEATDVVAISASGSYNVALRTDGRVITWGWPNTPPPPSAANTVAVAAGTWHGLAATADGLVYGWANNNHPAATPPASLTNAMALAAGTGFSLALRVDGTLFAWGDNWAGQTNVPAAATNIVSIAAGPTHAMALREDGQILVWGDTSSGQGLVPTALTYATAISAGNVHDVALAGTGELHFVRQPKSQQVVAGSGTTLSGFAAGAGPVTYQWTHDGEELPGATHAYLNLSDIQQVDAGEYRLIVANGLGATTSQPANVTVTTSAPVIIEQPSSRFALPGAATPFRVSAIGTGPLSYQWSLNGLEMPGATSRTLSLANVQLVNGGVYQVIVRNSLGSATSVEAKLDIYALNRITTFADAAGLGAWGDYDNDGKLDLFIGGKLYRNLGDGNFADAGAEVNGPANFAAWGDFDNDGYLDLLLMSYWTAQIWHNQGNGHFENLGLNLAGDYMAAPTLADFNLDGRLDILLGGALYQNLGNNQFALVAAGLPDTEYSTTAWSDFDGDGWPDVVICGLMTGSARLRLYRNLGNGSFSEVAAGVPDIYRGMAGWLDFDADGRPDLLISGATGSGAPLTALYRNNGDGSFMAVDSGLRAQAFAWITIGDYDNDGNPDLFLTGNDGIDSGGRVYRGSPSGRFQLDSSVFPHASTPYATWYAAWGDYDADGRLDLTLSNWDSTGWIGQLYHNDSTYANLPPVAPTELQAGVAGVNTVCLKWGRGQDAETPTLALSYGVRMGRTSGTGDVVAPDADQNGLSRLAQAGNAGQRTSLILTNLPFGRYFWTVQTVDSGWRGSPFAAERSFRYAAATRPATEITSSQATFNGSVDSSQFPATVFFEWGTTTDYGNMAPAQSVSNPTASVGGMLPATVYHCRVVLANGEGVFAGNDQLFVTLAAPTITVQDLTGLTCTSATVNALVNPNRAATWVRVEYGLSSTYGGLTSEAARGQSLSLSN